jgi:hypothetical protein
MAVPSRKDKMICNKMMQARKEKKNQMNSCQKQFPDCPITPDIKEEMCRLCPYNKELKAKS